MTGGDTVAAALRLAAGQDLVALVERLGAWDRYQASEGIERAADFVAGTARAAGLADVGITTYAGDGRPQWWTFDAPLAWTPTTARIELRSRGERVLEVDHARSPFALATYSAATPPGGTDAPLVRIRDGRAEGDLAGAVAVVGSDEFARPGLLDDLVAAGAEGFLTDAPARTDGAEEHRGRIELGLRTPLFAFSLTPAELALVAERAVSAHVRVEVDRSARMPVVTGVLPGDEEGEVWVLGHLCHPRPGANDNASGVAAVLGAAAALARGAADGTLPRPRRTVRFLWGPEFLGTVAFVHDRLDRHGRDGLPLAVVDLDMVGEDQRRCASPFVVERSPDLRPTLLNPITEHVVEEVFAATADEPGTWQPAPFVGFSDHALFADPKVGVPGVQLCHPRDRFNHSAGDTIDKVSPVEMLRATAAAAAVAHAVAGDGLGRERTERVVSRWCDREAAAARDLASTVAGDGAWGARLVAHVERHNAAVTALARGEEPAAASREPEPGPVLAARWPGLLNIRAMTGDVSRSTREALAGLFRAEKENHAILFNLAIRADGTRGRQGVADDVSLAMRRPLDQGVVTTLLDALVESGWVAEGAPVGVA